MRGVGGLSHLDPEIRGLGGGGGGLKKIGFFLALQASVWSKNKGGVAFPGSASEAANRLHRLLDFFFGSVLLSMPRLNLSPLVLTNFFFLFLFFFVYAFLF